MELRGLLIIEADRELLDKVDPGNLHVFTRVLRLFQAFTFHWMHF